MKLRKITNFISSPKFAFFLILWLIVLLFLGTLYQKDYGLYLAQKEFFFSVFFFLGGIIPLPGGLLVMTFLTLSLLGQIFIKTKLNMSAWGTFLIHLGALILLFQGPFSLLTREEGYLEVAEGEESFSMISFHEIELSLTNEKSDKNFNIVTVVPESLLRQSGKIIIHESLPFEIRVNHFFRNCFIKSLTNQDVIDENHFKDIESFKSDSGTLFFKMSLNKDYEQNRGCLDLSISHKGVIKSHRVLIQGDHPEEIEGFEVKLRLKERPLPFSIYLNSFKKVFHPDTRMPKSFTSIVKLNDGKKDYQVKIEMNKPLRYKEFTLYQSSYKDDQTKNISIFQVVRDVGRIGPYFSSIMIIIGALLHLFVLYRRRN